MVLSPRRVRRVVGGTPLSPPRLPRRPPERPPPSGLVRGPPEVSLTLVCPSGPPPPAPSATPPPPPNVGPIPAPPALTTTPPRAEPPRTTTYVFSLGAGTRVRNQWWGDRKRWGRRREQKGRGGRRQRSDTSSSKDISRFPLTLPPATPLPPRQTQLESQHRQDPTVKGGTQTL